MSRIILMAFTAAGYSLAQSLGQQLEAPAYRVSNLAEFIPGVFKQGNVLVFIGAVGIAVRGVAPYIKSKAIDPAVIVIDEGGRFVIPILSGHIGGANDYALKIGQLINAVPVITTATDINNVFAVDSFAAKNGYFIANPQDIKAVSLNLLEKKEVGLQSDYRISGSLPKNIRLKDSGEVGISISCNKNRPFNKTLHLLPKCFHLGIGARKNTNGAYLEAFFLDTLQENNINTACVARLASIDMKKDEPAICNLSEKYNIPYIVYSKEELLPYEAMFPASEFVKEITGVGNVCETAAYVSSNMGEIIQHKTSKDGMTIAIAKEDWRVIF